MPMMFFYFKNVLTLTVGQHDHEYDPDLSKIRPFTHKIFFRKIHSLFFR